MPFASEYCPGGDDGDLEGPPHSQTVELFGLTTFTKAVGVMTDKEKVDRSIVTVMAIVKVVVRLLTALNGVATFR